VAQRQQLTKIFTGNQSQEKVSSESAHDLVKYFIDGQVCAILYMQNRRLNVVGNSQEPGNIAPAINVASSGVRERGVKSAGLNGTLLCPWNDLAFLRSSLSPVRALIVCIGHKI
jgi:hypothetical protein